MKTFRLIGMGLLAVLMSFTIASCGDDEEDEENNKLIEILKTNKWYHKGYDAELLEEQRFTMYFINEYCGVTHFWYKYIDLGSKSEADVTFNYTIKDNTIIIHYDGGDTWKYLYIDGCIVLEDGTEIYKPQSYTIDDIKYIKQYDPKEIERKKNTLEIVNNNLKVKEDFDGYVYTYTFEETLAHLFPSSEISYGIMFYGVCRNKYCDEHPLYCEHRWYADAEKNGEKYMVQILPVDYNNCWGEYEMYLESKNFVENKIKNGEQLSKEEKEYYERLIKLLKEMQDNYYTARPYVIIDKEPYILENYKF